MLTCQTENKQLIFHCLKENTLSYYFRKKFLQACKIPPVTFLRIRNCVTLSLNTPKVCILKWVIHMHTATGLFLNLELCLVSSYMRRVCWPEA